MSDLVPLVWRHALDGIIVYDSSFRVQVWNVEARRCLGVDLTGQVLGREQLAAFAFRQPDRRTPIPDGALAFVRAVRGDEVRNQLVYVPAQDLFITVSAAPLRDDAGAVAGAVATFRDVTGFVDRDEFRRDMTHLLVHDLKNVICVVMTNLAIARGGEAIPEALADADEGARRAIRLVTNLLDVTRLEEGRLILNRRPVDVAQFLRDVAGLRRTMAREQDLDLDVVAPASLTLSFDAELITRVLENILDNAFRYTPRRGRIELAAVDAGGHVELRVGNTGAPIPEDARRLIFQKSVQLSHAAAQHTYGLGLYFSRLVVEAHRGTVRVESTPTLPTVFVLELPARA